jgi:hypothetical protein
MTCSQTTTTATALSAGAVGWRRSNILNPANLHTGTGKRTKGGLGTWPGGLGRVTTLRSQIESVRASSIASLQKFAYRSSNLDVQGIDTKLLAPGCDVLSRQHGSIRGRLITIGLDLHSASDTADCLATTTTALISLLSLKKEQQFFRDEPEIGDMDECIVEAGENAGNAEDEFA